MLHFPLHMQLINTPTSQLNGNKTPPLEPTLQWWWALQVARLHQSPLAKSTLHSYCKAWLAQLHSDTAFFYLSQSVQSVSLLHSHSNKAKRPCNSWIVSLFSSALFAHGSLLAQNASCLFRLEVWSQNALLLLRTSCDWWRGTVSLS